MSQKLPEQTIAFGENASRELLKEAGIDPDNIDAKAQAKLDASQELADAATILGLVKDPVFKTSAELVEVAHMDPLLWKFPVGEEMAICKRRAKLSSWIIFDFGPELSDEEVEFLVKLDADHKPHRAVKRLWHSSLWCSDEALADFAGLPELPPLEDYQRNWIKDLTVQVPLISEEDYAETEERVAAFFGDGLPMTVSRWNAWKTADIERRRGVIGADAMPCKRTIN